MGELRERTDDGPVAWFLAEAENMEEERDGQLELGFPLVVSRQRWR